MFMKKEAEEILEFIHYAEGLKKELRALWLSDGSRESTAEHSWRMALFVMAVVPKLKLKIDTERAMKIAIAHDIVEIEAGDICFYHHFGDEDLEARKRQGELGAIKNVKKKAGDIGEEIYNLWHEYEDQKTNEAKLVKALDKLEARTQFVDSTKKLNNLEKSKLPQAAKYIEDLCSIDPFLAELDKLTREERSKAAKIEIILKDGKEVVVEMGENYS